MPRQLPFPPLGRHLFSFETGPAPSFTFTRGLRTPTFELLTHGPPTHATEGIQLSTSRILLHGTLYPLYALHIPQLFPVTPVRPRVPSICPSRLCRHLEQCGPPTDRGSPNIYPA